ncbi:MAG: hypothetical protein M0C28_24345 [Candidatus Moduliflexus flocculans]|nr:hypothetical protein [Candidatus Moduliflexus flocculans]
MALPSGTYEIAFTLQGFKTLIRKDIIARAVPDAGPERRPCKQAALEEQVTVVGQSPLIDVKSTAKGMTLTKEIFHDPAHGTATSALAGHRHPRRPERAA